MLKTKFYDFKNLKNCNELQNYIEDRIEGHNYFYHYTSANSINEILKSNCIFLSSVKRLNDKKENFPKTNNNYTNKYYVLCFSTGKNENLSLWYLYSGIDGNGGRIELTKKKIIKLMESSNYSLCQCNKEGIPEREIQKLKLNKDIFLTLKDVVYEHIDSSGLYCDLKYNTMTNYRNFTVSEMEIYKKNNIGFVKNLIWYYEKEARILAELSDDLVDLLENDITYLIKAQIGDEIMKSIKIKFAPEVTDIYDVSKKYSKIDEFIKQTSRVKLSDYQGEMEMRLFDENKYKQKICSECEKNIKTEEIFNEKSNDHKNQENVCTSACDGNGSLYISDTGNSSRRSRRNKRNERNRRGGF